MFLELGSPLDRSMLFPGKSYFCHFCIASCQLIRSEDSSAMVPEELRKRPAERSSKALKSKANDDYENKSFKYQSNQ